MSAAVHTPGQWQAVEWSCHRRTTVVVDDEDAVTGKRVIAECETEADARVIAAAPALLKAMQDVLRMLDDGCALNTAQAHAAVADAIGSAQ